MSPEFGEKGVEGGVTPSCAHSKSGQSRENKRESSPSVRNFVANREEKGKKKELNPNKKNFP